MPQDFMLFEYSISGKWLELLKQIAPNVTRVTVLGDPDTATGPAQFGVIQAVAPSLRVEVKSLNKRDSDEIERALTAFARRKEFRPAPSSGALRLTRFQRAVSWQACLAMPGSQARSLSV